MKKITITAATIIGNRGAEAMLCTAVGKVREQYPDTHFNIYSYYPNLDRNILKDNNITIYSHTPKNLVLRIFPYSLLLWCAKTIRLSALERMIPKSVTEMAAADVHLDVAGVSFIDGREKFLAFNILTILPSLLFGVPVVKLAQATGPYNNQLNALLAKMFLSRCARIFARGKKTLQHLTSLLPHSKNYELASDIAFLYKSEYSLSQENDNHVADITKIISPARKDGRTIFGICPSSVVYKLDADATYIGTLIGIIEELVGKNGFVVLFPNATLEDPTIFRNNDLAVIQKIDTELQKRGLEHYTIVSQCINTNGIKSIIKRCDLALVSRFHAMIAALSLKVPVLVIGWSHKYKEIMEHFNQEDWVVDYKQSTAHELLSRIPLNNTSKLSKVLQHRKKDISDNLPAAQQLSQKQFAFVLGLLAK